MSDQLLETLDIDPVSNNQDDLRRKKQEIQEDRIENQHEDMISRKINRQTHEEIDLTVMPKNKIEEIVSDTDEYLGLAATAKPFINNDFKGYVPNFARNIILVAAPTGNGKSTTCANIAYHALLSGQRVLVITNEEVAGDIYNRITCIVKGWAYTNHGGLSKEQLDTFKDMTPKLSQKITVVDDNFSGAPGQTTTVEGFEAVLESLIIKKAKYDVIIFDYYQNVTASTKHSEWSDWKCQEKIAKYLDSFKQRYNAPVLVLAQLKDKKEDALFKERIEGRKIILNVATCAIELAAEREDMRTSWTIRKSRFSEGIGKVIYTGFDKGKYTLYTPDFANQAQQRKDAKKHQEVLSSCFGQSGIKGENNEK